MTRIGGEPSGKRRDWTTATCVPRCSADTATHKDAGAGGAQLLHQVQEVAGPAAQIVAKPMLLLPEVYATCARRQQLELAPTRESPPCPTTAPAVAQITITEPRGLSRYLYAPDTPRELSTIRLAAAVAPATEEIV